jgi:hypothetical protein
MLIWIYCGVQITPPVAKSHMNATVAGTNTEGSLEATVLARTAAELAATESALARRRARAATTAAPVATNAAFTASVLDTRKSAAENVAGVAGNANSTDSPSLRPPPQYWLVHCKPMRLLASRDFRLFQVPTPAATPSKSTKMSTMLIPTESGSRAGEGIDAISSVSHLDQYDCVVDLVVRVSYARPTASTPGASSAGGTTATVSSSGTRIKAVLFESPPVRLDSRDVDDHSSFSLAGAFTARLPLAEHAINAAVNEPQQPGSLVVTIFQRLAPPGAINSSAGTGASVDAHQRSAPSNPRANKVIAEGLVPLSVLLKSTDSNHSSSLSARIRRTPLVIWAEATPAAGDTAAAANATNARSCEDVSRTVGGAIKVELELAATPNEDDDADSANESDGGNEYPCCVLAPAVRAELRNVIRESRCWARGLWLPRDAGDDKGDYDDDGHENSSSNGESDVTVNSDMPSNTRVSKASTESDATKGTRALSGKTNSAAVFQTAAALRQSLTNAGEHRVNRLVPSCSLLLLFRLILLFALHCMLRTDIGLSIRRT